MIRSIFLTVGFFILLSATAQDATRWRGPSGNGIYAESGLLKTWPAEGPEILWSFKGLGKGHSSVAIADGFIYTMGMLEETGYLFKFDMNGKLLYKKPYGPEYIESFHGSRGTPVIVGDKTYMVSGFGVLYCFENEYGNELWSKNLLKEFQSSNIRWGINETPVVDGDVIYVTPGGKKNNMVALDRHSGKLLWSSPGNGELSAYCTPLLFEHGGKKILATHTSSSLIGIDASNGKYLWKQHQPNEWSVHPNTPVYSDGKLFYTSGYGQGGGLLQLSADGNNIDLKWTQKKMDSRMGGMVLINGYIYGSGDSRVWSCYNWETGKEMYASKNLGIGVVIAADDMLYCYSQRGELAMVEPITDSLKIVAKTQVTMGTEQHWAHPVIDNGVLYVRHGNALIAYKIK